MLYYKFSDYLKNKYGTKVYKLPVNIASTCPNRDGQISENGCIFCGEEGTGFENLSSGIAVKEQLLKNAAYIGSNYNAQKFIAYFQNYSNTYMPFELFKDYINEACIESMAAIYISTRPDCIEDIELGLQTVNYHTLKILNRGHSLAEFIDAAGRIKRYGLDSCAHFIVDLPMDSLDDVIEGAKILSALGINQVKCHSMYILKNTVLGDMYESGGIAPLPMEEYVERLITFLEYLDPGIVIQRLIGRAPEERSLFCNWETSWWKIRDVIEGRMTLEGRFQGKKFNYLGGSALKRFMD